MKSLSFLFVLFSVGAHAQWDAAALNWGQQFAVSAPGFPDGLAITGWAALQRKKYLSDTHMNTFYQEEQVPSPYFHSGKRRVVFYRQPFSADLVIVLPGIFNNLRDGIPFSMITNLGRRGYHVLHVPNSWSLDYQEDNPKSLPANFEEEAATALDTIRFIVHREQAAGWKGRVHVLAESYGSYLAAVVMARDAGSPDPVLSGQVTVVGPPTSMLQGIEHIDSILDGNSALASGVCKKQLSSALFYLDILNAKVQSDMKAQTLGCLPTLVAYSGFQDELRQSALVIRKNHPELGLPAPTDADYDTWVIGLRFKAFIGNYLDASALIPNQPKSRLSHWLSAASAAGMRRFRILSADNDFLNSPGDWMAQEFDEFRKDQIMVLPWGGHLGFASLPAYQDLLDDLYGPILDPPL